MGGANNPLYVIKNSVIVGVKGLSPLHGISTNIGVSPPEITEIRPDVSAITETLVEGTLINAITAISALAVLSLVQYGENNSYWKERIGKFYFINRRPMWDLNEHYLPPLKGDEWRTGKKLL